MARKQARRLKEGKDKGKGVALGENLLEIESIEKGHSPGSQIASSRVFGVRLNY